MSEPAFRLRNSVIRNPQGKIKFKRFSPDGYEHYHIGLWLESQDSEQMNRVTRVVYTLHPTFKSPTRESKNRANDFSITFWSWGTFEVSAEVHLNDRDEPIHLTHMLEYDLPGEDAAYAEVGK